MRDTRLWAVVFVLMAGVGVGWWTYSRGHERISEEEKEIHERFRSAREAAMTFSVVPPDDRKRLLPILSGVLEAQAFSEGGVPDTARERLAGDVVEFLHARYADSANAYIAWRRRAGYRPRSLSELRERWFLDLVHELRFGEPAPKDADWEELHARMIEAGDRADGGRHRLAGVAADAQAVAVSIKRLTRSDPRWPPVGGVVGELLDTGGTIHTSKSWWAPPVDAKALLEDRGEAWVGNVGFIAEFGDGTRRPLSLSFVWDPERRKWGLFAAHAGVDRRGAPTGRTSVRLEF